MKNLLKITNAAKHAKLPVCVLFLGIIIVKAFWITIFVSFLDTPKLHDKAIIRLEPDEVANLLDMVESGENLTDKQKQYHKKKCDT